MFLKFLFPCRKNGGLFRRREEGLPPHFLLGAASGFRIGPCTAPVLGVLLGFVALKTHVVMGIGLLFVFAFGMGTLLILARC